MWASTRNAPPYMDVHMPTFGKYETERPLHEARGTAIWAARLSGDHGPARYAVKAAWPGGASTDVFDLNADAPDALVTAAAVQEQVARGSTYWAPIFEHGTVNARSWYVTELYPRSAQTLIEARTRVNVAQLQVVTHSVIQALIDLRDTAGRPHGNIKPSNVLISGDPTSRTIEQGQVILSDPAAIVPQQLELFSGDLLALGRLIHSLVTFHSFRAPVGWPVRPSPDWARLGKQGAGWLRLCTMLLDPNRVPGGRGLEDVAERVRRLGGPDARPLRTAAAVGVAAMIAVAAGGFTYRSHLPAWLRAPMAAASASPESAAPSTRPPNEPGSTPAIDPAPAPRPTLAADLIPAPGQTLARIWTPAGRPLRPAPQEPPARPGPPLPSRRP